MKMHISCSARLSLAKGEGRVRVGHILQKETPHLNPLPENGERRNSQQIP